LTGTGHATLLFFDIMFHLSSHDTGTRAKPFVKWVGGKTQLLPTIGQAVLRATDSLPEFTYVEPFVGGGAVLFWILENAPNVNRAVINDINGDLVTTYTTIRDNTGALIARLREIEKKYKSLATEERRREFYLDRRNDFNARNTDAIENSALFIFLNRTCFNGLFRVNSKGLFNVPFGRYENPKICNEDTLLADSVLLQKVEILAGDFEDTLAFADKGAFFYIDPPYKPLSRTSSFNSYAKEEFGDREQIRLKQFCDALNERGSLWMLSNSDVKSSDPEDTFFDDLYSQYEINRVRASRVVNANPEKRGKLTELLINNCRILSA
jgi:DNA adenine methylase